MLSKVSIGLGDSGFPLPQITNKNQQRLPGQVRQFFDLHLTEEDAAAQRQKDMPKVTVDQWQATQPV